MGLAGLQAKSNEIEMEAYQRSVALALVQDMASRIAAGRQYANGFATNKVYGTNDAEPADCAALTGAARHLCEWSNSMKGAAESRKESDGNTRSIGAPIGMRGCVLTVADPTPNALAEYFVVGVWQGLTPTASPAANTPGARCAPDVDFGAGQRRAVVIRVLIPKLAAS
ncbi:Uncharacterized protein ToN1_36760 [Aromatoleum petrolei]|nr:Uncharacterized protein ToN1_36760 [Aromatoleum petrolei]